MIAIVTLLVAFPAGFLLRRWQSANITYIAAYAWAYSFQGIYLMRSWTGGDHSAFPRDPDQVPVEYGVFTACVFAAGFGLVALGHWTRLRLDARRTRARQS
jgi:hypothetical protein